MIDFMCVMCHMICFNSNSHLNGSAHELNYSYIDDFLKRDSGCFSIKKGILHDGRRCASGHKMSFSTDGDTTNEHVVLISGGDISVS